MTFMSTLVAELAPTPGRVRATLRIVVASLVAVTFVMALHIEHGPYAFISIFVVSQPNAGASFRKGVLRLLGTMAGAAIPEQASAMQAVALFGFLLVFLLAGLIFPVENIPVAVRWISNIVWGRYYIEIVRDALLQGGGWPAMWSRVASIGSIGAFMYLVAWRKMHRMQLEA